MTTAAPDLTTVELPALAGTADTLADQIVAATEHADASGLAAASMLLDAVDRMIAAVVRILQRTAISDVIANHGITTDTWLRAVAGRTGADAGMLLAAAERLADMPAVTSWFSDGILSWGTVRAIVSATRTLTRDQRRWVDSTLAEQRHTIASLDGDQIAAAVDRLANTARPDLHRERADRAFARRYLAIQPALDGTARIHGDLDAETAAAALQAFDTVSTPDADTRDTAPEDSSASDGRCDRRRTNVDTFKALCEQRVTRSRPIDTDRAGTDAGIGAAGDDRTDDRCRCGAAPSIARPSMEVVADIATLVDTAYTAGDVIANAAAHLLWRTARAPVELTAQAAQRLACDATLRVVLVDGSIPLGVGATHPKVSATMRAALVVRDGGCRFPACHQPADRCEHHHIIPRSRGGRTELGNLALLCAAHHHAVHEGNWHARLNPDATMAVTRRATTLVSQPRAAQHLQPTTPPPRGRPARRQLPTERPGDPDYRHPPEHQDNSRQTEPTLSRDPLPF